MALSRGGLLPPSVVLVGPTSLSAQSASLRPEVDGLGDTTRVLSRSARSMSGVWENLGRVTPEQKWGADEARLTVFGLR